MKLHLNKRDDILLIHSCARTGARHRIRIADNWHTHNLIVTPNSVAVWDIDSIAALGVAHFKRLAQLGVEIILLGTGARMQFPSPAITTPLMRARIGLEVMDTAAACRTYNFLAGDGRAVAAALFV